MLKNKNKALKHLRKDPVMARMIKELDYPKMDIPNPVYLELLRSIIYQQISIKAAGSIYQRFLEKIDFQTEDPDVILSLDFDDLQSCGLSRQKTSYIINIAQFFKDEQVKEEDIYKMSDEDIIQYFTQIKGVGRWTVEMLLIFTMFREDVFPEGDYAVQVAIKNNYNLKEEKSALLKKMRAIAEPWRPYRTLASNYCWQWIRANRAK